MKNSRTVIRLLLVSAVTILSFPGQYTDVYAAKPGKELRAQIKASKPGGNHKLLSQLLGDWKIEISLQSELDSSTTQLTGTSHNKWILGKRFIQSDYKTKSSGRKVKGTIMLGYDNISREFVGIGLSNFSSGITTFRGQSDNKGTHYKFDIGETIKQDGTIVTSSASLKIISENEFRFTVVEKDKLTSKSRFQTIMRYWRNDQG